MYMRNGLWLLHPSSRSLWKLWSFLPVPRLPHYFFITKLDTVGKLASALLSCFVADRKHAQMGLNQQSLPTVYSEAMYNLIGSGALTAHDVSNQSENQDMRQKVVS